MKTSARGLQDIRTEEGLRLKAYRDGGGVPTIGYGHTNDATYPVKMGQTCTKAEAEVFLRHDVAEAERMIDHVVKVPLNGNQYGALVSLAFNIGNGAFAKSTLVKKLNAKDYDGAARQFDRWVNDNGKRVPGLVARRDREQALFNTPAPVDKPRGKKVDPTSSPEHTEVQSAKKNVQPTQRKNSTDPTIWTLITGGLAAVVQPVMDLYTQVRESTEGHPVAMLVAVVGIGTIGYLIYKRYKHNRTEET